MALFTLKEIIARLTRGFVKATGRKPDGLEKIKIKQEALERIKQQDKVVDMEGNVIDTSKGIMGGRQIQDSPEFGAKIRETYDKAKGPGKGQEMVDALKSPGAKKSYEIIEEQLGVKLYGDETFDEILEIQKTGKHPRGEPKRSMVDDAIEDASPGFANDIKYDAEIVAENLAERMGLVYDDLPTKQRLDLYDQAYTGLSKQRFKNKPDPEEKAMGGRIGLKTGMSRRAFLKLMGVAGAGIGALKTGILKLAGKEGTRQVTKNIIKTDNVPGKPEWFDALVTKVINEGEDMTKQFATKEREIVHMKKLDEDTTVKVTQDLDNGAIRVEYDSPDNMYGDPVQLQYKKPLPDEGDPRPTAEFDVAESGPVGRADGPDDYSIEIDEVGGTSIKDLTSDVSKLKEYAMGKKPTLKEFVQSKKRKDRAKAISEGGESEMDEVIKRQGEFIENDLVDLDPPELASGGIARMLGE